MALGLCPWQVLGDYDAFMYGVDLVAARTRFHNDFRVSVFEITIRTLGYAPNNPTRCRTLPLE
jgi:hypothetical protein